MEDLEKAIQRKLICKNCGREFIQYGRGRARMYCYAPDCEAKRKQNIISKTSKEVDFAPEVNVIYSQDIVEDTGFGDVIQAAREYGATRFKLIEQIQKVNSRVIETNKIEQDLLHKLEFIEDLTDKEAQEIAVSLKKNRQDRRVAKNLQFLVKSLLDKMPLKTPEKFVRKGIEMINEQKYNPKALEEIFPEDEVVENEEVIE